MSNAITLADLEGKMAKVIAETPVLGGDDEGQVELKLRALQADANAKADLEGKMAKVIAETPVLGGDDEGQVELKLRALQADANAKADLEGKMAKVIAETPVDGADNEGQVELKLRALNAKATLAEVLVPVLGEAEKLALLRDIVARSAEGNTFFSTVDKNAQVGAKVKAFVGLDNTYKDTVANLGGGTDAQKAMAAFVQSDAAILIGGAGQQLHNRLTADDGIVGQHFKTFFNF